MEYQVVTVQGRGPVGTDFAASAEELAALVQREIADGWVPVGGVAVGHPLGGEQPSLFQAMMRNRKQVETR